MPQTIESLIKLAETDRDLQKYIFAKSHLERQIDTARSVVDQHQKLFEQKILPDLEATSVRSRGTRICTTFEWFRGD